MLPPATYPVDVVAQIIYVRNNYHVDPPHDVLQARPQQFTSVHTTCWVEGCMNP
jgi:hypothetical protein